MLRQHFKCLSTKSSDLFSTNSSLHISTTLLFIRTPIKNIFNIYDKSLIFFAKISYMQSFINAFSINQNLTSVNISLEMILLRWWIIRSDLFMNDRSREWYMKYINFLIWLIIIIDLSKISILLQYLYTIFWKWEISRMTKGKSLNSRFFHETSHINSHSND